MNKRFQGRKDASEVKVDISDGVGHYPGVANNISYSGLVVDGISQSLNHLEEILSITCFDQVG